jgi:hypothetical protein
VTLAPPVVDSLKALDPNRPIREADIASWTTWPLMAHMMTVTVLSQGVELYLWT